MNHLGPDWRQSRISAVRATVSLCGSKRKTLLAGIGGGTDLAVATIVILDNLIMPLDVAQQIGDSKGTSPLLHFRTASGKADSLICRGGTGSFLNNNACVRA